MRTLALAYLTVLGGCSSHGTNGHSDMSMGNPQLDGAVSDLELAGGDLLMTAGGDLAGDDLAMPTPSPTPSPAPPFINFDGPVAAIVQAGDAWYYGGDFTRTQVIPAPGFVALDSSGNGPTCDLKMGLSGQNVEVDAILRVGSSMYVGGFFTAYQGKPVQAIIKIDATTCALDESFLGGDPANNGFGNNATVKALVTDGTWLYVGGHMASYRGVSGSAFGVARLNLSTGAQDPIFGAPSLSGDNGFDCCVEALTLVGSSLFVGGSFTHYRNGPATRIAKINLSDGSLDTTFSPPGGNGFDKAVFALATDLLPSPTPTPTPGPYIYAGGTFTSYTDGSGTHATQRLAKIDMNGNLDGSFGTSTGCDNTVWVLAVANNSLYVGGDLATFNGHLTGRLAKLALGNGAVDTTFNPSAMINNFNSGTVNALGFVGNALYAGGTISSHRGTDGAVNNLAKIDAFDGSLLEAFQPPGSALKGPNHAVLSIAASNSTVWLGGSFTAYGGQPANRIAKFDANGLDTTFTGGANGGFDDAVAALAADSTSLYVGGKFLGYRGTALERLAKLGLGDGALDSMFHPSSGPVRGFDNQVHALLLYGSSLYVGGEFSAYEGVADSAARIAKLSTSDGTLDGTFSPAGATTNGFNDAVMALALAPSPSPEIVVGGLFDTAYTDGAKTTYSIAKVNVSSGVADVSFSSQLLFQGFDGPVLALAADGDHIYVGGQFFGYQNVTNSALGLAKLTSTGEIDTTFSPVGLTSNGTDGNVYALAIAGGSLYVGGQFYAYRGVNESAVCIAKLDLGDGSLDGMFNPVGFGMNGFNYGDCKVTALAASSPILAAGGEFDGYRGVTVLGAVRLDLLSGGFWP